MVFSSLTFLWIFLPITLAINYLFSFIKKTKLKFTLKNIALLVFSLIFYAGGGISYVLIMLVSITANYLFAILINYYHNKGRNKLKKLFLILTIVFNIGLLVYYKYTNFLVDIVTSIFHLEFDIMKIILPIGISFFTFQSMSYVIDVYNNKVECQKNYINVALYISLFPQLIAGPIVKYQDVNEQIEQRTESLDKFVSGIKRFLYGLAKKVIVSNMVGEVAQNIFNNSTYALGTFASWIGIICYTIQIYYDFSGYSDMAIGLGKMFGFDFLENFNYPYTATSVREFWRRWHISLSSWFREYVYIPLGGNRKGKFRTYYNLFIVFLLTGIWHGANFTFLIWGVLHGVFMVIERLFLGKLLEKNKFKFLNWLYTMLVVVVLWVFFRSDNVTQAFDIIRTMFVYSGQSRYIFQIITLQQWIVLLIGILFCGPVQRLTSGIYNKIKNNKVFTWVDYGWQFCLYFICINLLINSSFNPFIYFQF